MTPPPAAASFAAIRGQDRAISRLKPLLSSRRLPPALLFCGPPGVGKATAALAFAKALNCRKNKIEACGDCPSCAALEKGADTDLHRVDSAYQAGLRGEEEAKQQSLRTDTIRHLICNLEMRSMTGRWKVAVIDDAHRLMTQAANAMLKALEEPPEKTLWILITHRPDTLPATVRSRCQRIGFAPLVPKVLEELLLSRGIDAGEAAPVIAAAEGSLGRALALLQSPRPDPATWLSDPLAPFNMADKLPPKLHLARPPVKEHLHRMAWHLRRERGPQGYSNAAVRTILRELSALRRALDSNVSPRLVLALAALRLQQLETAFPKGKTS